MVDAGYFLPFEYAVGKWIRLVRALVPECEEPAVNVTDRDHFAAQWKGPYLPRRYLGRLRYLFEFGHFIRLRR